MDMASETSVLYMKRIFKQSIKDKLITCATLLCRFTFNILNIYNFINNNNNHIISLGLDDLPIFATTIHFNTPYTEETSFHIKVEE